MEKVTEKNLTGKSSRKFWGYVEIGYIPFEDVLDIADQHDMNFLIDVNDEGNCKCLMYESGEQRLKAVIMTYLK